MAKRRKKLTDKQFIMMSLGFSAIFICGLMIFSFRDKIFEEPVEDVNWGEVAPEGVVDFEDSSTPEEIDITSVNGLTFERKNLYNLGISLYLPKNWEIDTSNPSTLYIKSNDSKYRAMEIVLTSNQMEIQHPNNLTRNMLNFIRYNMEYHVEGYTFKANTYATNVNMLQYLYDENHQVWVDESDPTKYPEVDEVVNAGSGKWILKNKFIGIAEHGSTKMFTEDGNAEANPYYKLFYTFIDNTEYFMGVMAPGDFIDECDEIAKTNYKSLQKVEPSEDIYLPSFDKTHKLGDISFKHPDKMTVSMQTNTMFRSESKNINSDDFGIGISAYVIDFKQDDYVVKDLGAMIDYKTNMFSAYTNKKVDHLIAKNLNEIVLSYGAAENVVIDGVTSQRFDTHIFLRTTGTEIEVQSERNYPSYGITYMIEKDAKVYIITVTYGTGNKAIAEKYARAQTKTIYINQ